MDNNAMQQRDHGGNLDQAMARHGGDARDWLDLSTGINPVPWPSPRALPAIPDSAWTALPTGRDMQRLLDAARRAYGVHPDNGIVAAPGTQSLIQVLPRIAGLAHGTRLAALPWPAYNEYVAAFIRDGWAINAVPMKEPATRHPLDQLAGADATVIINPNNPDGRRSAPDDLLDMARRNTFIIVDEAFADVAPELSLAGRKLPARIVVLRSFGKFFGLAGMRLGFAIGDPVQTERLADALGPWAVSGPALHLAAAALSDRDWIAATRNGMQRSAGALRAVMTTAGIADLRGTDLFVTGRVRNAEGLRDHLASQRIWIRIFPDWPGHVRFGLPAGDSGLQRLADALASAGAYV